jgi:MFS family permease
MVIGALVAGAGFLLLSQVREFWQFLLLRWSLVTTGGALMGSMVVSVSISRWFIQKRGRAIAIASLGQGIAKVGIPVLAASLFVWLGWRYTWMVFGILTLGLVVIPSIVFMRRSPEDMGLYPDGAFSLSYGADPFIKEVKLSPALDLFWSRAEVLRTRAFWLIGLTFGVANVGITGLNLHVFSYVSDIGYPVVVAATVMGTIAFTQLSSTLFWGLLSERIDIRKAIMFMFLIQTLGLSLAIATAQLTPIYAGFFLYGIGLGGSQVLQEIVWASYFGRLSLGRVRGLGLVVTNFFAAGGPPFFGFLYDVTKSYFSSFLLFTCALMISAFSILFVCPPKK